MPLRETCGERQKNTMRKIKTGKITNLVGMDKKLTKKPKIKGKPLKANMTFEALLTKAATTVVKKKTK